MVEQLLNLLDGTRVYDLAQPYFIGMPHYPTHPPYLFSLNKAHGDQVFPNGGSSAAETLTLGGHVGTHIDALCHFSCAGKMYGGLEPKQSYSEGIGQLSVDTIPPVFRRGLLLDVTGYERMDALPVDFIITPELLEAVARSEGVEVRKGDVVLLRTGWAKFWNNQKRYVTGGRGAQAAGPGPEEPGARWFSSRSVFAAGSDTIAFERVPAPCMPVHLHLLVEHGVYIIEALNLEELARERVYEFLFVAAPLRIRGGTGSPIRPVAVV